MIFQKRLFAQIHAGSGVIPVRPSFRQRPMGVPPPLAHSGGSSAPSPANRTRRFNMTSLLAMAEGMAPMPASGGSSGMDLDPLAELLAQLSSVRSRPPQNPLVGGSSGSGGSSQQTGESGGQRHPAYGGSARWLSGSSYLDPNVVLGGGGGGSGGDSRSAMMRLAMRANEAAAAAAAISSGGGGAKPCAKTSERRHGGSNRLHQSEAQVRSRLLDRRTPAQPRPPQSAPVDRDPLDGVEDPVDSDLLLARFVTCRIPAKPDSSCLSHKFMFALTFLS